MARMDGTARGIGPVSIAKLRRMKARELAALLSGDPAEAARWVELAARHGLAAAQLRLGRMLLAGTGVEKDEAAALGWFKTAARSGDADAMNMAGRCCENGWGTAKDNEAAAGWYRRSADAGHDWGEYNYANMLFDGLGVPVDLPMAVEWYRKACAQGHARAMNQVGRCHEEGWGVVRDLAVAADWYRQSAEGGYFRGQYNHAAMLAAQGRAREAAGWYGKAAEGGTLEIRRRIGRELLGGELPDLHAVGLRALALACEGGEASDFVHYGRVLLHGFHCRQDVETGVDWLRRAAKLGHEGAAEELSRAGFTLRIANNADGSLISSASSGAARPVSRFAGRRKPLPKWRDRTGT
jgi:TPR repeat protein